MKLIEVTASAVSQTVLSYIVIAVFGLMLLGGLVAFVLSIVRQMKYENSSLPSLGDLDGEETEEPDADEEELPSVFALEDDDEEIGDSTADEFLRDMRAAETTDSRGFNPFSKKK